MSVMVFLLHVRRLTLAISRFVSRNRILCEAAFILQRWRNPYYKRFFLFFSVREGHVDLRAKFALHNICPE